MPTISRAASERRRYGCLDGLDGGHDKTVQRVGQRTTLGASTYMNPQQASYKPTTKSSLPQAMNPWGITAPPRGISPRAVVSLYQFLTYPSRNVATATADSFAQQNLL